MAVAPILFGFLWTVVSAVTLGLTIAGLLARQLPLPAAFVVGACPLSLAVTLIALGGAAYPSVFLVLGSAVLVAGWRRRVWRQWRRLEIPRWFWLGFAPFFVLYLANAMAPELSPDGMAYHLGLVQMYAQAHSLPRVPDNMYASLSQGLEMLFLYAFVFGRHSAAALVHFGYLVALPLLLADFGSRRGEPLAGAFAGLFVFATPVVGVDGVSAYNDVALAAIWFTLFWVLEEKGRGEAGLAGTLAGFAYGVKYTAFTALLYLAWRLRWRPRPLAIGGLLAAAFVSPWLIRNAVWPGNPFAPLFNSLFPNPLVAPLFEADYRAGLRTYGMSTVGEAVRNYFFTGEKISGCLGPLWLLGPLGANQWTWLLAAAAFPWNIGTRFLIPALPFLAWGMGRRLARWPAAAAAVLVAHLALSWPGGQRWYRGDGGWHLDRIPWKAALRIESEEGYLARQRGEYLVARMIEEFVPADERIFAFSPVAQSYTSRPVTVSFYSTRGLEIRDTLVMPLLNYFWPMRVVRLRQPTPASRWRILQQAQHPAESWSISEISPRPRAWHPSRTPWSASLAVDGNPFTRWWSGAPLQPGEFAELTYERPVSEITLRLTRDQWSSRFQVAGADAGIDDDQETAPLENLRRWATETVRAAGYRYLVVSREDFVSADFRDRAEEWNLEAVAERGGAVLYRIR